MNTGCRLTRFLKCDGPCTVINPMLLTYLLKCDGSDSLISWWISVMARSGITRSCTYNRTAISKSKGHVPYISVSPGLGTANMSCRMCVVVEQMQSIPALGTIDSRYIGIQCNMISNTLRNEGLNCVQTMNSERQPIARPYGRAMGRLFWVLWRKDTKRYPEGSV